MFSLGITTREQYQEAGENRRMSGVRAAYNLLRVGENPTAEEIRTFEDISFTLRTSNGTTRTTFRQRFQDVDAAAIRLLEGVFRPELPLSVQDRAVSNALTSCEFAQRLYERFPALEFEASDLLLELLELSLDSGEVYIVEPNGTALQYIRPPFVVGVHHPEARRNPLLCWVAARARKRFAKLSLPRNWMDTASGPGYRVARISCMHPEAHTLSRTRPTFRFCLRSVFDCTRDACHVIRTMNIFNLAYFPQERLLEGTRAVFDSLKSGGIWIVGRTREDDFTNHVSFLRRGAGGWQVLERVGKGWDLEELAVSHIR
jgi:hypothetical protein